MKTLSHRQHSDRAKMQRCGAAMDTVRAAGCSTAVSWCHRGFVMVRTGSCDWARSVRRLSECRREEFHGFSAFHHQVISDGNGRCFGAQFAVLPARDVRWRCSHDHDGTAIRRVTDPDSALAAPAAGHRNRGRRLPFVHAIAGRARREVAD